MSAYTAKMADDTLITLLRSATEDDVLKALEGASVQVPLANPVDLLEFYHRMVDVLLQVHDNEAAAAKLRIPPGFGSTD